MKWLGSRTFWGLLFILGGFLFLLQELDVFQGADIFWGVMLGLIGLLFLSGFVGNRASWWVLIPGISLLGLAANSIVGAVLPGDAADILEGLLVLGGIGLSFWAVYLVSPGNWWAIIPGGVLVTLAVVASLESAYSEKDMGGVFFLGLGITFALVAFLPNPHGQMKWAYIPSVVLVVIGLVVMASSFPIVKYLWPVALILVGLYVLLRAFGFRRR
jgi:hypothetical protein